MKKKRILAFFMSLFIILSGCGGSGSALADDLNNAIQNNGGGASSSIDAQNVASGKTSEVKSAYIAPEITPAEYHESLAQGENGCYIDSSAVDQGYVAVSGTADTRMKFQVACGDNTYNYDLPNDGTPTIYSLQCGDGTYTFKILKNTGGSKYVVLYSEDVSVAMIDEFQPYLHTCQYADYDADSECVKKAAELAQIAGDQLGMVNAVYDYVCATVTYDNEKAETVESGYIPDPDETMATGKGICFDYASLCASMLRSQGIPTRIIFGYVAPGDLYHAWNMFYTEETGWVSVEFEVKGSEWQRIDLTFSANGAGATIGDGTSYTDVYVY